MFKTLNSKFIFFTITFILIIVGSPIGFLVLQFRKNFEQRSKIMVESTMDVVNRSITEMMMSGEQKQVQTIVENISNNEGVDHLRMFSEDGNILFSSEIAERGVNIEELSPGHVNFSTLNENIISLLEDERIYSAVRPILNQLQCQECHGNKAVIAYLDVDTNLTQAERYFYTGSIHMIFLGLAIIIALFFGFYVLFRNFINKPLMQFRTALDSVEKGDLNVSLPAMKNDEIGILEKHFNHMVKNLKDSKAQINEMHFEQLQRADKLVTLGELAAQMAHEINNPAAIILSRADCVQMEAKKNNDLRKYDEDLKVIMNQVNKVSRITGNMLKYSKKLPKQFKQVDLKQIIEECLYILDPRLIKYKISVFKQYEVENSNLKGDAHQLEQVVTNLINNAIDAMTEGGELKLIIGLYEDHQLQLKINDNGSGMDEKTTEHIFTPFFTTKSDEKGTGLGLYIVKNICKNHNADIRCFSKPGEGTTFTITFKDFKNQS